MASTAESQLEKNEGGESSSTAAGEKSDANPFTEAFYQKNFRLIRSKKPDATDELFKVYQETLAYYEEHGLTEYWGETSETQEQTIGGGNRIKRIEKPLAPIKKESSVTQRASVIQQITPSSSPRPSPASSPKQSNVVVPKIIEPTRSLAEPKNDGPKKKQNKRPRVESSSEDDDTIVKQRKEEANGNKKERKFKDPTPASEMACSICKELSVDLDNTIAQCNECSRLYHQQCHDPWISSSELNDPRYIFVCMSCTEKRVKQSYKPAALPSSTSQPITKVERKEREQTESQSQLFKRAGNGKEKGNFASASTNLGGLKQMSGTGVATLAADFLAKHKPVKKVGQPVTSVLGSPTGSTKSTSATVQSTVPLGLGKLAQHHQQITPAAGLGKLAQSKSPTARQHSSPSQPTSKSTMPVVNPNIQMQDAQKRLDAIRKKMAKNFKK